MPMFASRRSTSLLVGIGLVLIGLLCGVLGMLSFGRGQEPSSIPRHLQLGRHDTVGTGASMTRDSSGHRAAVELNNLNTLFRSVARRVTPSVVFVRVIGAETSERAQSFFPPSRSVGSGVIIRRDGYIVTNRHVVARARAIEVTLADGRSFEARVVGADPSTDLAVLKIDARVTPIVLGNSGKIQVGEWVLAVGNPFRLRSTVTAGIVSALGRQVGIIKNEFSIENFIQTDAAINPGNSGGALVNLQGELVGVSTAIATESGSYEGYGFAVPVNLVKRVVRDLIAHGEVRRGFLGVSIRTVDAGAARRLGLERVGGVFVLDVKRGAPADRAGLRHGDVVLAVEGERVAAANDLQTAIARRQPGERVALTVWREGQRQVFTVRLEGRDEAWLQQHRPDRKPAPPQDAREPGDTSVFELEAWGLGLRALSEAEHDAFQAEEGVYVAYVRRGSPAAQAGVPHDAVLTYVGGEPVESIEEALRRLGAHSDRPAVLLRVNRRNGIPAFYEVETP